LFMKGNRAQPQCGFSAKTVAALDMMLPDYVAIDVLQNPDIRDGIKAYGNWPTIPQLYVAGELVGGSDIVVEMFETGELGNVLGVSEPTGTPPRIEIDPAAAEIMVNAVRNTGKDRPGTTIHLKIDAGYEHSMSLAPPRSGSVDVTSGSVSLQLDRWSAARADGLHIRVRESLQGQGFSFDNPNAPPPVRQMTVQELKAALDRGEKPWLFDVRGDDERALASLPAARPWDDAAVRTIESLPTDTPIIFMCHSGGRSQAAAERYRRQGYTSLYNLAGGISAWSRDVDGSVPTY
ncbi:MAG: glutaredoxin domain-containing protein, partial [Gammaproteobacteria bacterium]